MNFFKSLIKFRKQLTLIKVGLSTKTWKNKISILKP